MERRWNIKALLSLVDAQCVAAVSQASQMKSPCVPPATYVPGMDLLWTSLSSALFLGSSAELLPRGPY